MISGFVFIVKNKKPAEMRILWRGVASVIDLAVLIPLLPLYYGCGFNGVNLVLGFFGMGTIFPPQDWLLAACRLAFQAF